MSFFTWPSAFRDQDPFASFAASHNDPRQLLMTSSHGQQPLPPHSSHPALPRLTMLVFEAVLEVVCVSLPGYIVARQGLFTAEMQKFTAELNVALFTPCLSKRIRCLRWKHTTNTSSLHQTGFPIDRRHPCGTGHHPSHLHRTNLCLFCLCLGRIKSLWIFKETTQLRHRHGCLWQL